jgi:hypothetical protein
VLAPETRHNGSGYVVGLDVPMTLSRSNTCTEIGVGFPEPVRIDSRTTTLVSVFRRDRLMVASTRHS